MNLTTYVSEAATAAAQRNPSVSDRAFELLFSKICRGELEAGQRITEESLCELTGVSRTPLRDAISRLQLLGLLGRNPNRLLHVTEMSMAEMNRLSVLRAALEGVMARNVTQRFNTGEIDLEPLETIIEQMECIDSEKGLKLLLQLGVRFHEELRAMAEDPMTSRMLGEVMMSMERYRHLVDNVPARGAGIVAEHREIIVAIRSGDPDAAEQAMRAHILSARAAYSQTLERQVWGQTPAVNI